MSTNSFSLVQVVGDEEDTFLNDYFGEYQISLKEELTKNAELCFENYTGGVWLYYLANTFDQNKNILHSVPLIVLDHSLDILLRERTINNSPSKAVYLRSFVASIALCSMTYDCLSFSGNDTFSDLMGRYHHQLQNWIFSEAHHDVLDDDEVRQLFLFLNHPAQN